MAARLPRLQGDGQDDKARLQKAGYGKGAAMRWLWCQSSGWELGYRRSLSADVVRTLSRQDGSSQSPQQKAEVERG